MVKKLICTIIFNVIIIFSLFAGGQDEIFPKQDWDGLSPSNIHFSRDDVNMDSLNIDELNSDIFDKYVHVGYLYIPSKLLESVNSISIKLSDLGTQSYTMNPQPAFASEYVGRPDWLSSSPINGNSSNAIKAMIKMELVYYTVSGNLVVKKIHEETYNNFNDLSNEFNFSIDDYQTSNDLYFRLDILIKLHKKESNNDPLFTAQTSGTSLTSEGVYLTKLGLDFGVLGFIEVDIHNYVRNNIEKIETTNVNLTFYDRQYDTTDNAIDLSSEQIAPTSSISDFNKLNTVMIEHNYNGNNGSKTVPNFNFEIDYDGKLVNIVDNSSTIEYDLYMLSVTPGISNSTQELLLEKNSNIDLSNEISFKSHENKFDSYKRGDFNTYFKLREEIDKSYLSGIYKGTINYKTTIN